MFFGLANTLRSLTASPIKAAVDQAHRMARRRLEAGGVAGTAHRGADAGTGRADYVLPVDVDPVAVALAVHAKLRRSGQPGHGESAQRAVRYRADGRAIVAGDWVHRLGDGDVERGKRVLERIVADIRLRRRVAASTSSLRHVTATADRRGAAFTPRGTRRG